MRKKKTNNRIVTLFDNEVELDKILKVYLTTDDMTLDDLNYAKISYKDLELALINREPEIITTILDKVSVDVMEKGYEIMIISEGKSILVSDYLLDGTIRQTHNWYKILFSGRFEITTEWHGGK